MKGHPKGLIAAALSNMGERFGYYIMNAVLVLFLCSKFGLAEEKATLIYSIFYMGIYILSLVGGIIADRTQNYKGTIQHCSSLPSVMVFLRETFKLSWVRCMITLRRMLLKRVLRPLL